MVGKTKWEFSQAIKYTMTSDNLQKVTHIVFDTYRYCVRLYKLRERKMFLPLDLLKLPRGKKRRAQITTERKKSQKEISECLRLWFNFIMLNVFLASIYIATTWWSYCTLHFPTRVIFSVTPRCLMNTAVLLIRKSVLWCLYTLLFWLSTHTPLPCVRDKNGEDLINSFASPWLYRCM